ncbi:MAG TPA: GAF domain-containing protein [Anaerolinea sp.]|nr:GAF domain-containing protein [Anaerolinea sp.]
MRLKNQNKLIPQGFDFQQNPIPLRSFILILAAIFLVEAVIMQVLHVISLPVYVDILVDSGLLVVVILPVLYFTFLRPMMTQYQDAVNAREAAETLWRSSMDLARTMELEKVYQIMLDQVARLAPYDIATLCLLTSPSRLDVETVRNTLTGNEAKIPAHLSIHPEDYPLLSQVIREEKSKVVADVSAEKGWVERPYLPAMRSWIGIPLVVGGKVVGLCELGRRGAGGAGCRCHPERLAVRTGALRARAAGGPDPPAGGCAGERAPLHRPRTARRSGAGGGDDDGAPQPARAESRRSRGSAPDCR